MWIRSKSFEHPSKVCGSSQGSSPQRRNLMEFHSEGPVPLTFTCLHVAKWRHKLWEMTVSLEPLLTLIGPLGVSEWITAIMKSRFLFSFFANVLTEGRGKDIHSFNDKGNRASLMHGQDDMLAADIFHVHPSPCLPDYTFIKATEWIPG